MINLDLAPQSGRILAYASDQLIYSGYQLQDGAIVLKSGAVMDLDGVYELHLFDAREEYRAILQGGEWTESVMRAQEEAQSDDDHFVFSETQFVQERFWVDEPHEKIVVNNRFSFDEEGFLRLVGYRLAMEAVSE